MRKLQIYETRFYHLWFWFIIRFCYWNGYCGNLLKYISIRFPETYQTIFSRPMILNIPVFLVHSALTSWETGKSLPNRGRPLSGVRFQCHHTRQKSHADKMTPENPFEEHAAGDWHMPLIRTYKASSCSLALETDHSMEHQMKQLFSVLLLYQTCVLKCNSHISTTQCSCHENHTSLSMFSCHCLLP